MAKAKLVSQVAQEAAEIGGQRLPFVAKDVLLGSGLLETLRVGGHVQSDGLGGALQRLVIDPLQQQQLNEMEHVRFVPVLLFDV